MAEQENNKQPDDVASEILENLKNNPVEIIDPNKRSSPGNKKKYFILLFILILVLGGGFAAWKFLLNRSDQPSAQPSPAAESQAKTAPEDTAGEPTEEYTSDSLMIDFKYPTGWKVKEGSDSITISSPEAEVATVEGDTTSAEFKLMIKQGADRSDSEYLGRGLALKKSSSLKYSDPATGQRKKTFITDFGLDSSDNFAYFVVEGNFELEKDETLGPDFAKEPDAILVSGGFYTKGSAGENKLVATGSETYASNEFYKSAVEIVKTLQLR